MSSGDLRRSGQYNHNRVSFQIRPRSYRETVVVPGWRGKQCPDPLLNLRQHRKAADALSRAGYDVEEVTPPLYEEVLATWGQLLMGDYASLWDAMAPMMGRDGRHFFGSLFDLYPKISSAADMSQLLITRDRLARAWSEFMADYPLILSPTWTQLPFTHGFDVESQAAIAQTMEMMRTVTPANFLGLPSACVPVTHDQQTGLPIGVLLTGRRFRDDQCLDAAEAIERASDVRTPIDPSW